MLKRFLDAGKVEVGIDEAGRGSLIGNVFAGAVIIDPDLEHECISQIKDSKKISKKKRLQLRDFIEENATAFSVGSATPAEIDDMNILHATYLAMHRALDGLDVNIDNILVDGNSFKPYMSTTAGDFIPHECVIDGDNTYTSIACASILAKVYHDEHIEDICKIDPSLEQYDLLSNMGYGTKKHIEAIKKHGITQYHRKSFGIVKQYI